MQETPDQNTTEWRQKNNKEMKPWTWKHIKLLIERQTVTQNIVFLLLFPESRLPNGRKMHKKATTPVLDYTVKGRGQRKRKKVNYQKHKGNQGEVTMGCN